MTESQTEASKERTRSALGGFERDAKTFQGHYDRIMGSAEAFVKRHEKFAKQEPGHERLAETAELLAEAKRIVGQDGTAPAPAEVPIAVQAQAESDAYADAAELAALETAVTMLARLALADAQHEQLGQADHADALSYLRNWLGHLAPLPKREPAGDPPGAYFEGRRIEPNATPLAPTELVPPVPFVALDPDPAAGLIKREQERVQAVLDAAAAKAAPVNPLAAALAPMPPVDPFAAFRNAAPQ